MQIRQVVAMADASEAVNSILPRLGQLGLQICEGSAPLGRDTLLVCDTSFLNTVDGRLSVRHALREGSPVLTDPARADALIDEVGCTGGILEETRKSLEAEALYACMVRDAAELSALQGDMPRYMVTPLEKVQDLRYGENWHQTAALYSTPGGVGLQSSKKLGGRELSYNNVVDAETVLEMLIDLSEYGGVRDDRALSVIVKHANPCGVAYGRELEEAYRRSFTTDPKSAFGGVIGFNRPVDVETARAIGDSFVEVLLAPGYDPEALAMLTEKKPNRWVLDIGRLLERKDGLYTGRSVKGVFGGALVQDHDTGDLKEWTVVTLRAPTASENRALRFAWKVAKYVKSNALVYTDENLTIGIGSGQVSRVDSARFGAEKAVEHGLSTKGSVAATDSFFPFRDGLEETHRAGATAVVHPGGSIRDKEVIEAADEYDMAMVFTGMRHFRH